MLEGTDARVHYLYYTPEMEAARNRGGLQTNAFVRFRKLFLMAGVVSFLTTTGWNGWFGRYQKAR